MKSDKIIIDYTQDVYDEIEHQKKVIDKLSRKIQKLKTELAKKNTRYYIGGNEVILMSHEKFNALFGDNVEMVKVDKRYFNFGGVNLND